MRPGRRPALAIFLLFLGCASQNRVEIEKKTATLPKPEGGTATVHYPEVKSAASPELRSRIQEAVGLKAGTDSSLEEWKDELGWLTDIDYEVRYNDRSLLSLTYTIAGVGAYPSEWSRDLVVDLKTGRRLAAADLFRKDTLPALAAKLDAARQAAVKAALAEHGEDLETFREDLSRPFTVEDLDNFSVDGRGVTFTFDFGLPHVVEALEPSGSYFLSFEELAPYLDENGPLAPFAG